MGEYVINESELFHYGVLERSGRFKWGSGDRPYQRLEPFYTAYRKLRKEGMSEKEIANSFGLTIESLRAKVTRGKEEKFNSDRSMAIKLKEKGYAVSTIAERLGVSQGTVRNMLDPSYRVKRDTTLATADALREAVAELKYIDVGQGVEQYMGISRTKLKAGIDVLKDEGYKVNYVYMKQLGTGKNTTMMVLTEPGVEYSEVYKNRFNIKQIPQVFSNDGGQTYEKMVSKTPNIDSDRVQIIYGDQGGAEADGLIKIRRGVDDIALGKAQYAQVRIGVDDTHYLKGMAIYSDEMPDGIDIQYFTNKKRGTPKEKVFKEQTGIEDNPFGAEIRPQKYIDKEGHERVSAVGIVNEEGDWGRYTNTLASQVLSKQNVTLVKSQLDLTYKDYKDELDSIMSLTNPTVKKVLLESFSDDCDAATVHLKANAMPRQSWKVLLPVDKLQDNEVYAPTYRDGERVVLFRYPHAGTFEAADLIVNNRNPDAKKMIGNAPDAIGINSHVAAKMSGADFDGDFVIVAPNNQGKLKTSKSLPELEGFDPKAAYPAYEGMPRMTKKTKGIQMGEVSNLITDMTLAGAPSDEIARAVKHSMVVIDAEKHHLNYRQSAIDNGIAELKEKYQGSKRGGASTLISRAGKEQEIPERKMYVKVDPETGEKIYTETGNTRIDRRTGKTVMVTESVPMMSLTKDARTLSSGTLVEEAYATYANDMKALANQARKAAVNTKPIEYNPSAAKTYAKEVAELDEALRTVEKNRPLERQAQIIGNTRVAFEKQKDPTMDKETLKKVTTAALNKARSITGAGKKSINITPAQWNAIQAGAIHNSRLLTILDNTDTSVIRSYATPRTTPAISASIASRIKAMSRNHYTQAEIADSLGVSVSTVTAILAS